MITKTQSAALAAAAWTDRANRAAPAPQGSSGLAVAASDKVHCYGVHECKGNADCKTTENACKGQNACKGHSFKGMDAASCLSAGGTIGDLAAKK